MYLEQEIPVAIDLLWPVSTGYLIECQQQEPNQLEVDPATAKLRKQKKAAAVMLLQQPQIFTQHFH